MSHRCTACGKRITWSFALCVSCEQEYGAGPQQWPPWLSYLWNETQRERRRQKRIQATEVAMDTDVLEYLVSEQAGMRKLPAHSVDNLSVTPGYNGPSE